MTEPVYLIDTETTGLEGYLAGDVVVDIGIAEINLDRGSVLPMYSQIVGYETSSWEPSKLDAWIFRNSDLTVEDVSRGKPEADVAREVRELLNGKLITSYNVDFDFLRFLTWPPWNLQTCGAKIGRCVMCAAHRIVDGDFVFSDGSTSYPKLEKAYSVLCPDDPAELNGKQAHRALSDAVVAGYVLIELNRRNAWKVSR